MFTTTLKFQGCYSTCSKCAPSHCILLASHCVILCVATACIPVCFWYQWLLHLWTLL